MPLTRAELDHMRCPCGVKDCDNLHLKALCHPRAGLTVSYSSNKGTVTARCRRCDAFVTEIVVAKDLVVA